MHFLRQTGPAAPNEAPAPARRDRADPEELAGGASAPGRPVSAAAPATAGRVP
jgi:hypothetical protein